MNTTKYRVPEISCQHCVDAITHEVSQLEEVQDLTVDLDAKLVTVVGGQTGAIIDAIDEAGYDAELL